MTTSLQTTRAFRFAVICVVGAAIAFAFQLHRIGATYFEGEIVPAGNDAFYHARRILDTAQDPSAFYEFDPRIQAPEGSLLVWPWGFDYTVARIVRFATDAGLASDPKVALAYIPPFAVIVSISLATLLAWNLGLTTGAAALLVLSIAVSPLTQVIHGLASVDHHFAEYMFILAFLATAVGWMRSSNSLTWAGTTGLVLGLAPAVHTLLFILQVPLLITLFLVWVRGRTYDRTASAAFGLALLAATSWIAARSQPLHEGYFEHYYLSWFHVYVASCTSLTVGLLACLPKDRRGVALLVGTALILSVPLLSSFTQAAGYLGNVHLVLTNVGEAKSVWRLLSEDGWRIVELYSGLILLAPITALGCLWFTARANNPAVLFVCVYSALAIPLLLSQFRFHYYGSIVLALPLLMVSDSLWRRRPRKTLAAAAIVAAFTAAQIPALANSIRSESAVGRDPYFILTRLAMPALAKACAEDPGIVLAKNNEGHFIRYYTECSVIANNFLLTPQQVRAFFLVGELYNQGPEQLLDSRLPIKYVLVRSRGAVAISADGGHYMMADEEDARMISDPLTDALLWSDPADVPSSYRLIAEIPAPGKDYPYARIWKVQRPEPK